MITKIKNATIKAFLYILAISLTLNFTVSLILWYLTIQARYSKGMTYWPEILHALIAIVLWCSSLTAVILLLSKKTNVQRYIVFLLLVSVILSVCCFVYDTQSLGVSSFSMPIMVIGSEQYHGIGYRYRFHNWPWYEKDILMVGDFTEENVFHHFFGHRRKGYISSSTLTFTGDLKETVEAK